ncbi:hypothetical protein IPA_09535 [Ignicoccus pacificus DSM 13166]|uniref:Uncharacterized protein n=1 Tax=Ignicoccus pacificus DSM 13166 TaxID=940294 RepID=A0A977KC34_9CREN|nr:hypothetical protein IPA_09535 [Ignicoccus pacificus DSM 13166]
MIDLAYLLIGFIKAILYFNTLMASSHTDLTSLFPHNIIQSTQTLSTSNCTIQIVKISNTTLPIAKATIVVTPLYLKGWRNAFIHSIEYLVSHHVEVILVKPVCKGYVDGTIKDLTKVVKSTNTTTCYGWGPEALICMNVTDVSSIADSPQGSYELMRSYLSTFGAGGYLALEYLYGKGLLFKYAQSNKLLVNGKLYGFSNRDVPLLLWSPEVLLKLIVK